MIIPRSTIRLRSILNYRTFNISKNLLQTSQQPANDKFKEPLTFQTNHEVRGTPEERMRNVFGGRIAGSERVASSRREIGDSATIAGVKVPSRPKEPDNCCMSGCVNCVWEQYNDDVKDWRHQRSKAIKAIRETNDLWPLNFDPPLTKLEIKNVPRELRPQKRKLDSAKKITTASYFPRHGAPGAQNILNQSAAVEEEEEEWKNVPVSFRVFAETEKRVKEKKAKRAAKSAEKKAIEQHISA